MLVIWLRKRKRVTSNFTYSFLFKTAWLFGCTSLTIIPTCLVVSIKSSNCCSNASKRLIFSLMFSIYFRPEIRTGDNSKYLTGVDNSKDLHGWSYWHDKISTTSTKYNMIYSKWNRKNVHTLFPQQTPIFKKTDMLFYTKF